MIQRILFFILIVSFCAHAQEASAPADNSSKSAAPLSQQSQNPAVRLRPPDDLNKESSSFIGDPENLDPLRTRKESLKEDDEPVLEDIRSIIDQPTQKPPQKVVVKKKKSALKPVKKLPPKITKKARKKNLNKFAQTSNANDPDETLERRFHQNYQNYNSSPTSVEAWSKATFGRSSEVYIVQKDDSLWTISETLFGDSLFWPKIWALNRQGILNPNFITPGMNIHFYPGTQMETPTLSVNDQNENNDNQATDQQLAEQDQQQTKSSKNNPQTSDSEQQSIKHNLSLQDRPTPLPPSLPVYRSELYFTKPRTVDIIDLKEPETPALSQENDFVITDRVVLSDILISVQGDLNLSCYPGELLQNFEFVRQAQTTEYTILEPLDKVQVEKETTLYPYKKVGKVSLYGDKKLKIKECNSFLSRSQIFVPTNIIESLKTKKQSQISAKIVGGPIVYEQVNYQPSQFIYVSMGPLSFESGQVFGIKSRRTDAPAGKIKIVERYGNFALALITDVDSSIQVGDEVISQ